MEGEAENLNTFAKTWLGASRTHYLREVSALSDGDLLFHKCLAVFSVTDSSTEDNVVFRYYFQQVFNTELPLQRDFRLIKGSG